MNTQRPLPVTIAIVLLAELSLGNLLTPVISEGIPASAIYILVVLGVLGLVGADAQARGRRGPGGRPGGERGVRGGSPCSRSRTHIIVRTSWRV